MIASSPLLLNYSSVPDSDLIFEIPSKLSIASLLLPKYNRNSPFTQMIVQINKTMQDVLLRKYTLKKSMLKIKLNSNCRLL